MYYITNDKNELMAKGYGLNEAIEYLNIFAMQAGERFLLWQKGVKNPIRDSCVVEHDD